MHHSKANILLSLLIATTSVLSSSSNGNAQESKRQTLHTPQNPPTLDLLVGSLKKCGYTVSTEKSGPAKNRIRLTIEKSRDDDQRHGVLNIRWQKKERWILEYVRLDSTTFQLLSGGTGIVTVKAPLGSWQERARMNKLPKGVHCEKFRVIEHRK